MIVGKIQLYIKMEIKNAGATDLYKYNDIYFGNCNDTKKLYPTVTT